jgi:cyclopropane fatty-acyl-phospholipid synthase-like methyltransferase
VDLILVDGIAERGEPLATILRNQSAGLVPGGKLVLRSLVLTDERAAGSSRFRDWAAGEPVRPRLRSAEELSRILQEARLSVTGTSSTSDDYAADVEQSWGDALDRIRALHRDPAGRALIPTLLSECERWLRRIELVREGILAVRQITATRHDRNRR